MVLVVSELHIDALLAVLIGAALLMASLRSFEWLAERAVARADARSIARTNNLAATSTEFGSRADPRASTPRSA
jgi:hypothetical protein